MKAKKLLKKFKKQNRYGPIPLDWNDEDVIEIIDFVLSEQKRKDDRKVAKDAAEAPPKLNDIWEIQWGEAVGKKYKALVRIDEDKKKLNPPNWRHNQYKCELKGEELIVPGDRFIKRVEKPSAYSTAMMFKIIIV